jgi:hypothetical protein
MSSIALLFGGAAEEGEELGHLAVEHRQDIVLRHQRDILAGSGSVLSCIGSGSEGGGQGEALLG